MKQKLHKETTITGDEGMARFQHDNCEGCYFADKPKIGTGEPCCQFGFRLTIVDEGSRCLTKKEA